MVKLTALQCAPLLLPLASSFILPPPSLFSAFEVESTEYDNDATEANILPFSPFFGSGDSLLSDLLGGSSLKDDTESDSVDSVIIIDLDNTGSSGFSGLSSFGSSFADFPLFPSIFDQLSSLSLPQSFPDVSIPKPTDVLDKLEFLVASRFDALEQKIGSFQETVKAQIAGLIAGEAAGKTPLDSGNEITSLDGLRYWDVDAWLQPESENEKDLVAWHDKHHDHDHEHDHHDHDHRHHHSPPDGAIQRDSTLLDMIKQTSHSEMFYSFIKDFPDIEKMLDDENRKITVFVPSNKAFEHLLNGKKKEDLKMPKEDIEKLLKYHIMDGHHDYDGLKWHNTIASEMNDQALGKDEKQRLRMGLYRCPTVNLYSEILIKDYIGKNGVIHAVNHLLLPPPEISDMLNMLPTGFSTTLLALEKTGLADTLGRNKMLNNPSKYTVFAPTNSAWEKIPMSINAFLFSEHGKKYLEAIMKYHLVEDRVIYSDGMIGDDEDMRGRETHFPAGYHHLTADSMLKGKSKGEGRDNTGELNIDITRFPEMLSFRVNGNSDIMIANGVAKDGVIHVPNHIFMPPCQDLPDHGHHDLKKKRSLDMKVQSSRRGFLDGIGQAKDESSRCLDLSVEMEDNEETLEKFKAMWEPYL